MRIEKLNDYQIKFLLSNQDLKDRNITFTDLLQRSDKLQGLVREIMKKASETIDFNVADTPVMVEALPHKDGIALIVSKTTSDKMDSKGNPMFSESHRKHLTSLYNELIENRLLDPNDKQTESFVPVANETENNNKISRIIYTFDNLNDVISACHLAAPDYNDESSLYKMNDVYFLVLRCIYKNVPSSVKNCFVEYGERYPYHSGRFGMLEEYGKVIIKQNAVKALAQCK